MIGREIRYKGAGNLLNSLVAKNVEEAQFLLTRCVAGRRRRIPTVCPTTSGTASSPVGKAARRGPTGSAEAFHTSGGCLRARRGAALDTCGRLSCPGTGDRQKDTPMTQMCYQMIYIGDVASAQGAKSPHISCDPLRAVPPPL